LLEFKMKDLTPYSFKIPEELLEYLRSRASRDHTTVSQILRGLVVADRRRESLGNDQRLAG
jgi:hypothetical protein